MGRSGGATGLPETEGAACPSVNPISVSPTAGSGEELKNPDARKRRGTKELLNEGERGE